MDSYLRLFNSRGQILTSNDDRAAPGESGSLESYLEYTFSSAGTYYIGISGYGNSSYNATTGLGDRDGRTGNYELVILTTGGGPTSDTNDQISEADTVSVGTVRTGNVDLQTDVDVISFSVDSGDRIAFDVDSSDGLDSYIRLFDSSGSQLAFSDDDAAPGESRSRDSYLAYDFASTGTYYLGISGYGNSNYNVMTGSGDNNGSTGAYSVSVTLLNSNPGPGPQPTPVDDWFTDNITDTQLQTLMRSSYQDDSVIDRNEIIAILRDAKDQGNISRTELTDLQTMLSAQQSLGIGRAVRNLTDNVINGDVANSQYQGQTLGDLQAGSSATHMENLIGKWFLGLDRPEAVTRDSSGNVQTRGTYREVQGSLFVNGVSYDDITQGALGSCYLLAAAAAIAPQDSSYISNMFIDNGDDTYTVRFYIDGVDEYVTVDSFLPTNSSGQLIFTGYGDSASSASTELWAPLLERAYAQLATSGELRGAVRGEYADISGGWPEFALEHITGREAYSSSNLTSSDRSTLNDRFSQGYAISLAGWSPSGGGHAEALVDISSPSGSGSYQVFNPWNQNQDPMTYTWSDMLSEGDPRGPYPFTHWAWCDL